MGPLAQQLSPPLQPPTDFFQFTLVKKQSLDALTILARLSQITKHPLLSSCHDGAENHANMTQINISLRLPAVQNDAQQQA